jgi:hypothetical protein
MLYHVSVYEASEYPSPWRNFIVEAESAEDAKQQVVENVDGLERKRPDDWEISPLVVTRGEPLEL